jgi:hypothetical protein
MIYSPITQHLIAGHQVELDGDRAICRADSINVHLPVDARGGEIGALVLHGNEYRFELERTQRLADQCQADLDQVALGR